MKIKKLTKEEKYLLTGKQVDEAARFIAQQAEDTMTPEEALAIIAGTIFPHKNPEVIAAAPFVLTEYQRAYEDGTGYWTVRVEGYVHFWNDDCKECVAAIYSNLWNVWQCAPGYNPDAYVKVFTA